MATNAVSTAVPSCAPSVPALPRRHFLGALAGGAVAAPAATLPLARLSASTADRSAWNRTMRAYLAADAAAERQSKVFCAIADRVEAVAPRPSLSFLGPKVRSGQQVSFHLDVNDLHRYDDYPDAQVQEGAARTREAWEGYCRAAHDMGQDVAGEEADRLSDEAGQRLGELIEMPAPDRNALLWKLEQLYGSGSGRQDDEESDAFCAEWVSAVMADARRLLGRGPQA